MPNRILKESICTSATIDALTEAEECFFYRLMVQLDDFGRMDARPQIVRAKCYPLRLDTTKEPAVKKMLSRLAEVGLLHLYTVGGLPYLQYATWDKHQQVRAKRSKYPAPDEHALAGVSNGYQMQSDDVICPRNPIQSESNPNPIESSSTAVAPLSLDDIAELWNAVCGATLPKVSRLTPRRRTHTKARLQESGRDLDWWRAYFGRIVATPFCRGENKRNWKASFDFAVESEDNVAKVLEGQYGFRPAVPAIQGVPDPNHAPFDQALADELEAAITARHAIWDRERALLEEKGEPK